MGCFGRDDARRIIGFSSSSAINPRLLPSVATSDKVVVSRSTVEFKLGRIPTERVRARIVEAEGG
jgi:hypothetical protein